MTSPTASLPHSGGGFLMSPPASTISSSSTTTTTLLRPHLPHPRSTPLRPGGNKEGAFIRYVDVQLLNLQRRFAQRTDRASETLLADRERATATDGTRELYGYASMRQACRDVEALIDIVWLSGTPSLQVPYMLNVGVFVCDLVRGMTPAPRSLFRVLRKCDHAFASLLQGRDVESGERLPGFFGAKGVSATEKVRIRSLVERTRVTVFQVFEDGEFDEEEEEVEGQSEHARAKREGDDTEMDEDTDLEGELVLEGGIHEMPDEEDETWHMQIARVYDRTMVELGDSLEEPTLGVITENRIPRGDMDTTE